MIRKRYNESQILRILRENENGTPIQTLIKRHGISQATFYNWKAKYGNHNNPDPAKLQELMDENDKLKKMYAELSLENLNLKKQLEKKEMSRFY